MADLDLLGGARCGRCCAGRILNATFGSLANDQRLKCGDVGRCEESADNGRGNAATSIVTN
jgi:hypothetical protein